MATFEKVHAAISAIAAEEGTLATDEELEEMSHLVAYFIDGDDWKWYLENSEII